MTDARIRLVVLYGGRSAEHDVSCVSARHVLAAADPDRYEVVPVGITREGRWVLGTQAAELLAAPGSALPDRLEAAGVPVEILPVLHGSAPTPHAGAPTTPPDTTTVVFPVLHGPLGEDGTIQGLLELAEVPYVGAGVLASAVCMDKAATKVHLAHAGLPLVRHVTVTIDDAADRDRAVHTIGDTLGFPVFVKPANMGSSVGVSKVDAPDGLAAALDLAASYDRRVVVEESARGREIEVAVLGNDDDVRASLPGEIVPGADFYDYSDKYDDGADLLVPAPLDDDEIDAVQKLAVAAYRACGVEGLARVDFFYEDGRSGRGTRGWLVNEINTMPGFTPISMYPKLWAVSGLEYPALVDRLVELALERHARQLRHRRTDH